MATFPALTPSAAPITPGAWPSTTTSSLNGAESRIRHGSAAIGGRWRPQFINITETDFLAILNHYRGQRSGFDSFGFSTITLAADRTPTGFAWLYAGPPQVVDQHLDCFTVQCEFKCEPRGLVVAPGGTWRTGATTFSGAPNLNPDFQAVVLLCGFNGANNSTTFIDEGPLNLSLTGALSDQKLSTEQSVFGGSSLSLNSFGSIQLPTDSRLTLSADFTVEARCRFITNIVTGGNKRMLLGSKSPINRQIFTRGDNMGVYDGSTYEVSNSFSLDTWYALRWARNESTMYFFVDGSLIGTATVTGTFDFSGGYIGSLFTTNDIFSGFIDELRISNFCRSTASYPVSAAQFSRL